MIEPWMIVSVLVGVALVAIPVSFWFTLLAASPLAFVRKAARRFDSSLSVAYAITSNVRVTSEELDVIADDTNQYLRCVVASHPFASPDTLRRLGTDESRMVRGRLLGNPRTPEDVAALIALEMMVDGSLSTKW